MIILSVTFRSNRTLAPRQKQGKSWPGHLLLKNCYPHTSWVIGAGHFGLNILYWMCTFNFRPKFQRRSPSPFQPFFFAILQSSEIFDFWLKIESIFFGLFFINLYYVVLIIPSVTFRSIQTHARRQKQAKSWPGHLIFKNCYPQVSQVIGAGHFGLNILYWMCTFNFRPKFQRRSPSPFQPFFFAILQSSEIFDFWLKIEVNIFWTFFHKSILRSPDNALSNFQVHPNTCSQSKTSKKLAWLPYF